jgi:hypothetical protein
MPGPRDVGVYINAALDILTGENPYTNSTVRFGTFGALPFAILAPLTTFQVVALIQLLGIIGFQYLAFVLGRIYELNLNWLVLMIPFFASSRENLTTAQVNGVLCGFLGIAINLLSKSTSKSRTFFATLLIAIVIDLKPHLMFFFVLVIMMRLKKTRTFVHSVLLLFLAHGIIDFLHQEFLELTWIRTLNSVETLASNGSFTDSHTFWPTLSLIFNNTAALTNFSIILALTVGFISTAILGIRQSVYAPIVALLAPTMSIYFHLYDLVPFAVMVLALLSNRLGRHREVVLSFFLSQSVQGTNVFSPAAGILLLTVWLFFNFTAKHNFAKWNSGLSMLGLCANFALNLFFALSVPEGLIHSTRLSLFLLYSMLVILYLSYLNRIAVGKNFVRKDLH